MGYCLNIIINIIIVILTILTMIMIIQIMIIAIMVIRNTQLWGEQCADSEALRQPWAPLSDNAKVIMIIINDHHQHHAHHHDRLHHHLHHRYQEAEKMHLKAIQIKESLLGLEDYEVAFSYKTSTPSCSFIY